jgi:dTDP-4-amino-4,6-dideoxygalactose transaminase
MSGEERELVQGAFEGNFIAPLGPMVDAFEREFAEYTGIPHCVALSSGTAAMHLALRELGVRRGDEVLASTLTFIGSVTPATFLGARLVFIDSERASWNMDPELLDVELSACARRGKRPRAVITTDLYGQCVDLDAMRAICDRYDVPLVSDSAEAMGSRYVQHAGNGASGKEAWKSNGDSKQRTRKRGSARSAVVAGSLRHAGYGARAAVFSFNGNKIITTSGGGMLASHDRELIEHARKLSQQAREPVPHYEHVEIGYNYRLSNVLAAIGRGQLRVLDQRVERRRAIFDAYRQLLGDVPGIEFMPEPVTSRSNRWLSVVLIRPRRFGSTNEEVRRALENENIEARPLWKPMHLQPVFRGCRVRGGGVSEDLFAHGLCLPSGSAMSESDIMRVAAVVRGCARKRSVRVPESLPGRWVLPTGRPEELGDRPAV